MSCLKEDNSIAEDPPINPDKRSPKPALAVSESVPKSCHAFSLLAITLFAPFNKIPVSYTHLRAHET